MQKVILMVLVMAIFVVAPVQAQIVFHDADVNQDSHIELSELLRIIQFFNSGGYYYCPIEGTEDSFCPGQSDVVMVPVLLGLTEAQARASLGLLGFPVSVIHACRDDVAPGIVFSCSPGQSQEVAPGTTVSLWISTGNCPVECEPPQITVQPQPAEAIDGETVVLDVQATGTPTLMYSWHRVEDGLSTGPVDGSPLYAQVNSQPQNWYVVVSNDCGEVTSQTVTIIGIESGEGEGEVPPPSVGVVNSQPDVEGNITVNLVGFDPAVHGDLTLRVWGVYDLADDDGLGCVISAQAYNKFQGPASASTQVDLYSSGPDDNGNGIDDDEERFLGWIVELIDGVPSAAPNPYVFDGYPLTGEMVNGLVLTSNLLQSVFYNLYQVPEDCYSGEDEESYYLTTEVMPAGSGHIEVYPPQPSGGYYSSTVVTLTVVPDPNWYFSAWSSNMSPQFSPFTNPTHITMRQDETVSVLLEPTIQQ